MREQVDRCVLAQGELGLSVASERERWLGIL
jgi:hypothetical protein